MQSNIENQEIKIECTGCSNFCGLHVQVENGAIVKLEGNCCHRGIISAKRQLGIIEEYQSK